MIQLSNSRAFVDDFLEVRTDVLINEMISSEQRATLISVNSFTFSIVMIILSTWMGGLWDSFMVG